ncbi:16S rRNA (cytosine(1402)-N(4))-methyltransferase [bacterium (Candidatus Howlettbacteria) CG_4_10_14_0_8_um_filter_40_9]|nr:MAG: 16S rRNA (cytosine(1402)-N(4))-methyltransferase [bacterium (Candidatus Howlettbacteria) CG_4_10_14_0_8_um_filter_40_9]
MKESKHISVLLKETISFLRPKEGDVFVDGTLGLGGHAEAILELIGKKGKYIALDRDPQAIKIAKDRLKKYKNMTVYQANFDQLKDVTAKEGLGKVDGILIDLGVSSLQIDSEERGFSFKKSGPLDMRMGDSDITAADIVNEYSAEELTGIFRDFGEEKFAKQIAKKIVEKRKERRIENTLEFRDIVLSALPEKYKSILKKDPATKVFQALRVEVNEELEALGGFLPQALSILKKGGRLAVISFHSLEDRIVKDFIRSQSRGCLCPRDFPVCRCGNKPKIKVIASKPVVPSEEEKKENPRSRSAKMRVMEKIAD